MVFAVPVSKWTCPNGRVPEVFMCGGCLCRTKAARSGRINKTNTMYDAILHTSRLSVPEAMVSTYDRQVLSRSPMDIPNKSLRYLYLFGFLGSLLSDTSSFHNGFSWSPISSRSFHDRVDRSADFNAVPDSDASLSTLRDGIPRKNWDECIYRLKKYKDA